MKYARGNFASNINAYRTGWENKAVNRFYGVAGLWDDPTLSVYADTSTVAGRDALIALTEGTGDASEWGEIGAAVIEDADRSLGYNLLNADAVHSGLEWDFAYDVTSKIDVQGVVSAGNWRWTSNERVDLVNQTTNTFVTRISDGSIADTLVNLNGVKVPHSAKCLWHLVTDRHPEPIFPLGTHFFGNTMPTSLPEM